MKKNNAFTLVEVLIVAAIIGLLAAIAIPNILAAKRSANEAAAKANLRALMTASETEMASRGHYPSDLAEFTNFLASAPSYCSNLTGGTTTVQGYTYSCTSDAGSYTFVAAPATPGTTGDTTYTGTTGAILTPL